MLDELVAPRSWGWVMNALASALRGTGDMLVPAGVVCFGVLLIIPLSPMLIYGYRPMPGWPWAR